MPAMKTIVRASLVSLSVLAGLGGCSGPRIAGSPPPDPAASSVERIDTPYAYPATPVAPPSAPAPMGLDDYKTQVARHVIEHNPERNYSGTLPPLLPAIVVLRITVDRDGQVQDVFVQRSRDPDASAIALASLRRSAPLPPPRALPEGTNGLTFSETFLFADSDRFQLRSLAPPQASE
jgi:protein TonB